MKKQFIYAALCIALMSSCSKDNDPGSISEPTTNTPDVIDEGSPVAIELGVGAPQVSVSTRGTGAAGVNDGDVALWDEQELKILMTEKNSLVLAKEDPNDEESEYIFKDLTFKAPKKTVTEPTEMKITNTTGAVKYYPLQGAYDFYGFSFDDAVVEGDFEYPDKGETDKTIEYKLTINGTQDIMIAKAELTEAQQGETSGDGKLAAADYAKAFSSWAARRGVQPTMNFKHLLSRLDFVAQVGATVDGGNEITINDNEYSTKWPADKGYPQPDESNKIKNGVYIKSIKVLNPKSKITVTIANLNTSGQTGITTSAEDKSISSFTLMRKPTSDEIEDNQSKNLVKLTPVTPGSVLDEELPIGNGIMIVPGENSFQMEIELMQYVMEHDGSAAPDYPQSYTWKESTLQTTVKLNADEPSKVFEAGNYYTITTKIFGFQKIEVTATLSKWENGGSIETNPEDDAFKQ